MAVPNVLYGVAVDSQRRIFVTFSDHVEVLDPSKDAVWNVPKAYSNPFAILGDIKVRSANRTRVDKQGRVFVPEYEKGCVSIFSADGKRIHELYSPNRDMKPVGVAFGRKTDVQNQIFVSDFDNGCIHTFNSEWCYLGKFGNNLHWLMGLAVDSKNRVFVAMASGIAGFNGDNMERIWSTTDWNLLHAYANNDL